MSQVAKYREKRHIVAKQYAPGGCPINVGKQKCGETQGLDIIMDFHKLYQEKMNEIDVSAGGDSLQEKMDLQEQWISDLTEQNKLLAMVIEELESETIGKVQQLEDKLNNAVKSLGEVDKKAEQEEEKGTVELEGDSSTLPAVEENLKKKSEENEHLKQEMEQMKRALFAQLAQKQDIISLLRCEVYQLQEKNSETLKETSIKDDIIRELRKELKRSKQKIMSSKKESEKLKKETAEKSVCTIESESQRIVHSEIPQNSANSAVIIIHRDEGNDVKVAKSKFDSSDSSECGLNENGYERVHTCRSENDMKSINWMRPTKERSILTKIRKSVDGNRKEQKKGENLRKLNIPRHIPVKTYVNNIEYSKELK